MAQEHTFDHRIERLKQSGYQHTRLQIIIGILYMIRLERVPFALASGAFPFALKLE
jgi:hypothetical protein